RGYEMVRQLASLQEHFPSEDHAALVSRLGWPADEIAMLIKNWCGATAKELLHCFTYSYSRECLHPSLPDLFSQAPEPARRVIYRTEIYNWNAGEDTSATILFIFADTPFGPAMFASTSKGLCYLSFV